MEGRFSKKFIEIFEEMEVAEAAFPIEGVLGTMHRNISHFHSDAKACRKEVGK